MRQAKILCKSIKFWIGVCEVVIESGSSVILWGNKDSAGFFQSWTPNSLKYYNKVINAHGH